MSQMDGVELDGVELVKWLAEEHPRIAAVILTTFEDGEHVLGSLKTRAKGYLLKDARFGVFTR